MKDSIMKKLQDSKHPGNCHLFILQETHLVLLGNFLNFFFHERKTSLFQLFHSLDSHTQLHWYLGLDVLEKATSHLWQISHLCQTWLEKEKNLVYLRRMRKISRISWTHGDFCAQGFVYECYLPLQIIYIIYKDLMLFHLFCLMERLHTQKSEALCSLE